MKKPYYHLVNFSFLPLQPLRHTHIRKCIHAHKHTFTHTARISTVSMVLNSPCPALGSATERNLGLMSQPPHLLQETKGLGVKCRLLRQPRGVERVNCKGRKFFWGLSGCLSASERGKEEGRKDWKVRGGRERSFSPSISCASSGGVV